MKLFPSVFNIRLVHTTSDENHVSTTSSVTFPVQIYPPASISGRHCRLKLVNPCVYNAPSKGFQIAIKNLPQMFTSQSTTGLLKQDSSNTGNAPAIVSAQKETIQSDATLSNVIGYYLNNSTDYEFPEIITFIPDGLQTLDFEITSFPDVVNQTLNKQVITTDETGNSHLSNDFMCMFFLQIMPLE